MPTLDDHIRSALTTVLADAPAPLTTAELIDRPTLIDLRTAITDDRPHRRTWLVAVNLAAAAALLVAIIVPTRRSEPQPTGSDDNASYLVPDSLPKGWVLLDVDESLPTATAIGLPGQGARVVFERADPPARFEVSTVRQARGSYEPANSRPLSLRDGEGSFDSVSSTDHKGWTFDFVRDGFVVSGQGWGEDDLAFMAETISVDDAGVVQFDPATGFTEVGRRLLGVAPLTRYHLRYGPSPTVLPPREPLAEVLLITVTRWADNVDPRFEAGAFDAMTLVDGRVAALSERGATWSPAPTVLAQVDFIDSDARTDAETMVDLMNSLVTIDRPAFDDLIAGIAAGVSASGSWPVPLPAGPVRLDRIGRGMQAWLCITPPSVPRRCRFVSFGYLGTGWTERADDIEILESDPVVIAFADYWYLIDQPVDGQPPYNVAAVGARTTGGPFRVFVVPSTQDSIERRDSDGYSYTVNRPTR